MATGVQIMMHVEGVLWMHQVNYTTVWVLIFTYIFILIDVIIIFFAPLFDLSHFGCVLSGSSFQICIV